MQFDPREWPPMKEVPTASVGLDPFRIERLCELIQRHIADGHYPGAQIAFARYGQLAFARSFGNARLEPAGNPVEAANDTLFLLYSQSKVVTTLGLWILVDRGEASFNDRVSDHIPEFARNSKGDITIHQVVTHQAGFPNAKVPRGVWTDHEMLRRVVSEFELEWWPGSRVHYHGATAHWTIAAIIEAITGCDYREFIRTEVLRPLGIYEIMLGVPDHEQERCADMHVRKDGKLVAVRPADPSSDDPSGWDNTPEFRAAGVPGGGGYATASAMAALYQMLANKGSLNGRRIVSTRMIEYATRNHTGDRVDENMGLPMHRGIGPHVRGLTFTIRGLGSIGHPTTFGHGGAGSSYSWADPSTGVSFSYLTNARSDEPWHTHRLDRISNLAHSAIADF
ncbi:MAG: serine hydrolase domain-containing protein [Chloroflexota bacterium]